MEVLKLNHSILRQILNDREAIDELREFLNFIIDDELSKDENTDCDLIDECINALEELDFENSFEKPHLTAILSEEKFIKKIQMKSILQKDRYKKLAVICASLVLLIAAGSVKTESGETVAKSITNKIASVFNIESIAPQAEESTAAKPETEPTRAEPVSETPSETPTAQQEEPTTQQPKISVSLEKIQGVLSKKAKTEYKLGEELDLSGVQIFAVYSNGNEKQIPLDECDISVPKNFSKDAGRYKITISYQGKSFSYNVTVYAEKESVILNSIYGTFPDGYNFKTESFDNLDFSGMTVTAVYSNGSEKNIPLSECEITVEKNFMELENKALVTVSYEGRTFSFVLTKEEQHNENI
ncbi:MAG: bacterial Ig-like domain-containing protein [Oscillospiraceae bacterium]|nr:bacterial Ig-like domain-containing protein [Oscillospiraceae bacterium]